MKIDSSIALNEFRDIISRSSGHIWMQDSSGNEYDLKSELSMYRAIGLLLGGPDHGLELYASDPNVEFRLVTFIRRWMKQSA